MWFHSICLCKRSMLWWRVSRIISFNVSCTNDNYRHDIDEVRGMRYTLQYNFTFHSDKGFVIDPVPAVAIPFIRALDRAVCKYQLVNWLIRSDLVKFGCLEELNMKWYYCHSLTQHYKCSTSLAQLVHFSSLVHWCSISWCRSARSSAKISSNFERAWRSWVLEYVQFHEIYDCMQIKLLVGLLFLVHVVPDESYYERHLRVHFDRSWIVISVPVLPQERLCGLFHPLLPLRSFDGSFGFVCSYPGEISVNSEYVKLRQS